MIRWRQRSLFIITYDEHGGFYDHVEPPPAIPPDRFVNPKFDFKRLGVRVPTLLISPWLDQGVIEDTFDHTTILKYLTDKFKLPRLLGDRVASSATNTFAKYILKKPRDTSNIVPKIVDTRLCSSTGVAGTYRVPGSDDGGRAHLAAQISDPDVRVPLLRRAPELTASARAELAVEQFDAFWLDRAKREALKGEKVPPAPGTRRKRKTGNVKKRRKRRCLETHSGMEDPAMYGGLVYEGVAGSLEGALRKAHDKIPPREGKDFAGPRVIDWGMQRGGFVDARLFWVRIVEDEFAPFKTE